MNHFFCRCDGKIDCPDGTDERDCGQKKDCEPNEFACNNFECLPKMFKCDSDLDCIDGSDEVACVPSKMHNSTESKAKVECVMGHGYFCDNGTKCVLPAQLCDGKRDCVDGSDEEGSHCQTSTGIIECEYPQM